MFFPDGDVYKREIAFSISVLLEVVEDPHVKLARKPESDITVPP
jgi:hypothetical protein